MPETFEETLERVGQRCLDLWELAGTSLPVLLMVVLSAIGFQVFVWQRARNARAVPLVCISLLGVCLPLPLIAVGARALSDSHFAPHLHCRDGSTGAAALDAFVSNVFVTSLVLIPLFILAGVGLARVMRARGFSGFESFAPIAAGIALAILGAGLALTAYAEFDMSRTAHHGPAGRSWLIWQENGELLAFRRTVWAVFGGFLLLAATLGGLS